jgi:hypothetical protein
MCCKYVLTQNLTCKCPFTFIFLLVGLLSSSSLLCIFSLSCCTHIHLIIAIHNLCTSLHITRGNPFMCKLSNVKQFKLIEHFVVANSCCMFYQRCVFLIDLLQVHYWRTKARTLFIKSKTIKVILVNVIFLKWNYFIISLWPTKLKYKKSLSLVDLYQLCKIWCLFLMGNLVEFFITCRLWSLVLKIFWSRIECYYKGGGIHNAKMWHLRLHKQSHLQSFMSFITTHECVN